jgi:hypothetical protein
MSQGILTPLQVNTAAGLLNNTGLKPLPAALTASLLAFNSTTLITNFLAAVSFYNAQSFATESTLASLLSIGSTVCPALGNSIPAAPVGSFTNLVPSSLGFSGLVSQTGNAYLGNGDIGQFSQGFMAVQGYIRVTNDFINSATNAATYLGPTFDNMSNLVTNNIAGVSTNLPAFAMDVANQGLLTNLTNIAEYGTPAALLQQIASVAGVSGGTFPFVEQALLGVGLTPANIKDLITNNVQGVNNPNGLSDVDFDKLQQLVYEALQDVRGDDLAQVLSLLEISTPGLVSMADLLNPIKVFPNSYTTLTTAAPSGPVAIYNNNSVNMNVQNTVEVMLPSASGCNQLAKIMPLDQAVANKAIQVSLQQVTGIANTTWPELAQTIQGFDRTPWDNTSTYPINSIVALAPASVIVPTLAVLDSGTVYYRAQQEIPVGANIYDTQYWVPTTLGGLSTMVDLPLVQAQTSAVPTVVTNYFDNSVATGTGPDGTITTCDVLGTAIDHSNISANFAVATTAINTLQTGGSLAALNAAYVAILSAGNDAAVITQIANANAAIVTIAGAQAALVSSLNTQFVTIAQTLSDEKTYQTNAGVDYFNLQAGEKVSVYGFVNSLPQFAQDTQACGANSFLLEIADTATLTGQSMVASLREALNQIELSQSKMYVNVYPSSALPITPPPAVIPVN